MIRIINIVKMIKSHFLNKKVVIYSPCIKNIDKSSMFKVKDKLIINSQWDRMCTIKNCKQCTLIMKKNAILEVDRFIIYSGAIIQVREDAKLILGRGYINYNCLIDCHKRIKIGNGTYIAENVTIRDSDNHNIDEENYIMTKEITIGDHVWIGSGATILKGVNIGDGAIVAAGAVVTHDVERNTLVAGVPARKIKSNVKWY